MRDASECEIPTGSHGLGLDSGPSTAWPQEVAAPAESCHPWTVTRFLPALSTAAALLVGCAPEAAPPPRPPLDPVAYAADVATWTAWRDSMVQSAAGPLAQVGLCHPDETGLPITMGSDPSSGCVIPGPHAAANAGQLVAHGDTLTFEPTGAFAWGGTPEAAAVGMLAIKDRPEIYGAQGWLGPVRFTSRWSDGAITVWIIDTLAAARTAFNGIERWPVDTAWRFPARFTPASGEWRRVPTVRGFELPREVAGRVTIDFQGETRELIALTKGRNATDMLVVIRDATSGDGSYPAGRFVDVPLPDSLGRTVVDFNRARNPDCAFTDASPCPLPPPENRFDVAITAGEKVYHRK